MPGWLGERLLGAALRAYPLSFREQYAREILLTLRDQRRSLPNATRARVVAFWARAVLDLLRSAARERVEDVWLRVTSRVLRRAARVGVGMVLVFYAMGNVIYDLSEPTLSMGRLAILVTAMSGLLGGWLLLSTATLPE